MKLSIAQTKTYNSFKNKQAAEEYKQTCLYQKNCNPFPVYTESKRIYQDPRFYLSEIEREIWNQQRTEFRTKLKLCSDLHRGDVFKNPKSQDFYWHQFLEFIPQEALPKSLLIKSLLLPYRIEAETYFAVNFKFLFVTNNHELIIP